MLSPVMAEPSELIAVMWPFFLSHTLPLQLNQELATQLA